MSNAFWSDLTFRRGARPQPGQFLSAFGFARHAPLPQSLPATLGRRGALEVRLARNPLDLWRAQRLRFKVFYQEMAARPNAKNFILRYDADRYDAICDHLLVIDHDAVNARGQKRPKVVGTYRLLRQDVAARHGGFYSQGEFDIAPLIDANPDKRFLELGRSCVLAPYRDKKTVELLWHGIWAYVRHHRIDAMIGCASFEGVDPKAHALALSFLHQHARADHAWSVKAHPHLAVSMDHLPASCVEPKLALRKLPPLIKGYLKIGARFGEHAVVDRQFGTTDVLVILPVSAIDPRYVEYYGAEGERYAA
ncbi:MAG: GNAT family N-acetyltransferase [Bosea sp. (in: a-proteobacteria)]